MKIDIIDRLEDFQAIKTNWDFVYDSDPQAQFFLSWTWLFGKLKRYAANQEPWLILAAKSSSEASDYVAFFPLLISVEECLDSDSSLYIKLSTAGRGEADNIGFICLPENTLETISAFANFLQQYENWSVFEMENILTTDQRMHMFLKSFSREEFDLHEHRFINDLDDIDCSVIPYVTLPDDWDEYLQNSVSTNTRQKIRRLLRKVEKSDEFEITHVDKDNLDRHIDILLSFWKASWEDRKGADLCKRILAQTDYTLRHCFEHNCLYLPVLWQGDKPLSAIANFMDYQKKSMLFLMAGRDETVKKPPTGIILHAHSIQYAIQNGFKVYDFLMGNESYKYSFGAQERHIMIVVVRRKNLSNHKPKLDTRSISKALQISAFYHRSNRFSDAERGYQQVLAVEPHHPIALYSLSVLMQRKGEYQNAEILLNTLIQVQPNDAKVWFSLGTLHQNQGQLLEAENAYRKALTLQPEFSTISLAIYHNLGYALQQQGKLKEAIHYYEKARELQPNSVEAEVIWANALYAQGTLPAEKQADYAVMNHNLGNKREQLGELKAAIAYYQQAITLKPDYAEAQCHLGFALQKSGKHTEAIACYRKALDLKPNYIDAEVGLFNTLYSQGTSSSENQLRYAKMNYALGNKLELAGDTQTAIEYYQQAININPDLPEAHFSLGLAFQKQGNLVEAIACYQKAQELRSDYIEAEVRLANAYHLQRKLAPEKKIYYALMNRDLGHKCKQAGDLKSAIEYYRQAIVMNPDLIEIRDYLRLAIQEHDNIKVKVSCAKN